MSTSGYLDGNEWGEAEFEWSGDRQCWMADPPLGMKPTEPPDERLELLRSVPPQDVLSEYVCVYMVKHPHEV